MKKTVLINLLIAIFIFSLGYTTSYYVYKSQVNELVNTLTKNKIEHISEIEKEPENKNKQEEHETTNNDSNENQYKHPIDIELEECINCSSTLEYPNCASYAASKWQEEIQNNLNLLKKIMKEKDYQIIKINQEKWEAYSKNETSMINKYITNRDGLINHTIGLSDIMETYKTRSLLLNEIYTNYQDLLEIGEEIEKE